MTWKYGAEGERFPVQPDEVWVAGRHTFICSDLMEQTLFDAIAEPATLVYTDPPYTQAMITGYRTKAGMPKSWYRLGDLYRRLLDLAGDRPCYLEGGVSAVNEVWPIVSEGGGAARWKITYDKKNVSLLYYVGNEAPPCQLTDMDNWDIPTFVMSRYPTGVVADCCAGRGLTAVSAEKAGWVSVNNELHPNRMSAALSRLENMGLTVERRS